MVFFLCGSGINRKEIVVNFRARLQSHLIWTQRTSQNSKYMVQIHLVTWFTYFSGFEPVFSKAIEARLKTCIEAGVSITPQGFRICALPSKGVLGTSSQGTPFALFNTFDVRHTHFWNKIVSRMMLNIGNKSQVLLFGRLRCQYVVLRLAVVSTCINYTT